MLLGRVEISQASIATISHLRRTSPTVPPTVTVELDSRKDQRVWTILDASIQPIIIHIFSFNMNEEPKVSNDFIIMHVTDFKPQIKLHSNV